MALNPFPQPYVMPDLSLVAFRYTYWCHSNGSVVSMIVGMGHWYDNQHIKRSDVGS